MRRLLGVTALVIGAALQTPTVASAGGQVLAVRPMPAGGGCDTCMIPHCIYTPEIGPKRDITDSAVIAIMLSHGALVLGVKR
jgi:hypothetical protein